MSYKVFVSYSWKNSAERRALSAEIKQLKNVELIIDKEQILPGQPVHTTISELLDKANCVVVSLTEDGLSSKEVLDEISRAHDRGKDLIPIVAKDTDMSSLPWYIRDLNWISYDDRDFDSVLQTIIAAIKGRANVLRDIEQSKLPRNLKKLIKDGANFIDVPLQTHIAASLPKDAAEDYLVCELKMRQTPASFVFRVPAIMEISVVAEYLIKKVFPHLQHHDYDWTFTHEGHELPSYHTFKSAGIRTGDVVYLFGNTRRPKWAPH